MTYEKVQQASHSQTLTNSPSTEGGCRKHAGSNPESVKKIANFDFVAFDWKGTLEAKLGNKRHREESALAACAKILLSDVINTGDLHHEFEQKRQEIDASIKTLLQTFKDEKEAMKKQKDELNITCTLQEVFERALDGAHIMEDEKREKLTTVFLREYNNPNPQHCHHHLTVPCNCKLGNNAPGKLFDGVHDLLQRLSSWNIPVALIRNSCLVRDQFHQNLVHSNAHHYFKIDDNVILSGEVGFAKPDRRIFEACARKCGALEINPERILFVGNETDADILGAKQMGWKAVLIRSTEKSSNGLADFEIDSVPELHKIIFGQ